MTRTLQIKFATSLFAHVHFSILKLQSIQIRRIAEAKKLKLSSFK
jgi:hypothetical protein